MGKDTTKEVITLTIDIEYVKDIVGDVEPPFTDEQALLLIKRLDVDLEVIHDQISSLAYEIIEEKEGE
jgi:hypothetical protein